jgi:5-methylcytosine-specific restriction endonuclease McrA
MKIGKNTKLWQWRNEKCGIGICQKCGKEKDLTVDHIVPQNILESLGLKNEIYNDEENFELTCFACNKFKGGRLDLANPKTIPLLKKYIELLK